jgi:phage baseplate assembly protein W
MTITTPQFDAPFRLDHDGQVATVEQGSPADVAACVYNIAVCPQGAKLGDPAFGVPSLLFNTIPLNTSGLLAALRKFEPRATLEITDVANAVNAAIQNLTVNVQVVGPPTIQSSS